MIVLPYGTFIHIGTIVMKPIKRNELNFFYKNIETVMRSRYI